MRPLSPGKAAWALPVEATKQAPSSAVATSDAIEDRRMDLVLHL
jgi:hypothetical protein